MNKDEVVALSGNNIPFLEEMYDQYLQDPNSISSQWKAFFDQLDGTEPLKVDLEAREPKSSTTQSIEKSPGSLEGPIPVFHEMGLNNLLNLYRRQGHLAAKLDPLSLILPNRKIIDEKLAGLNQGLLEQIFEHPNSKASGGFTLKEIIDYMEGIYCSTVGYEAYYLVDETERQWLQDKIENIDRRMQFDDPTRLRVFEKLYQSDYFEKFLAKKYVGKKRFSLEGAESLNIILDVIIEDAGRDNCLGVVIGMSHRGRLNALVNILKKPAGVVFAEFEENVDEGLDSYSDVKYHLGYSNIIKTESGKKIKVSLAFNPSHLESVVPVVMGSVRAKQTLYSHGKASLRVVSDKVTTTGKANPDTFIPVLVHGDASFAGQGVVAESLNLMNLEGYSVGGSIHVVVNNQIGFTAGPEESRSTMYATDLAKGFQIPIFHVNGDDPEAVFRIARLALEYRMKFHKDVIIDLICYRRHGHNEMDEPRFTQPLMYERIKKHPVAALLYEKYLLANDIVPAAEIESRKLKVKEELDNSFHRAHEDDVSMQVDTFQGVWAQFSDKKATDDIRTGIDKSRILDLAKMLTIVPKDFHANLKLARLMDFRMEMATGVKPLNWALAEMLAFGSILQDGYDIRLSGQDSVRGTFSQRHLSMTDIENGNKFIHLNHLASNQGFIEALNSSLSEFSVLGYEYGFSFSNPFALVIWEAQFGDFVNGAQVIIDQFIVSSEIKWFRYSGLVLLLPHGHEGQGPEHSSGRLERFLQLAAGDNIFVCNLTTSSQYFHLLRKQILRKTRKPLVLMTPKSLLRYSRASSALSEFTSGKFQPAMDDSREINKVNVKRVIFCSGKVYYDLLNEMEERQKEKNSTFKGMLKIAILRIEQLYPFPEKELASILLGYKNAESFVWCQEEPKNQGAWFFVREEIESILSGGTKLEYCGRVESPSTATGLTSVHFRELKEFIEKALDVDESMPVLKSSQHSL